MDIVRSRKTKIETAALFLVCGAAALRAATAHAADVFVYSTRSDNKVHIVAEKDLSALHAIEAQVGAHELAASPDGRWIIGSAYGGPGPGHQPPDKRIVIIDAQAKAVARIVDLHVERPNDIAFSADGKHAVITVESPPRLVKLNPETGEFSVIQLEHGAGHMLALHPMKDIAYVAHVAPGRISVIDLQSGKTSATLELPSGAEGIACSPDGSTLWVACNRADVICIIDTASNSIRQMFVAHGFPFRVRFAPDGKRVAVSFPGAAEVRVFDVAKPETFVRISVKADPADPAPIHATSIAFSRDGSSLGVVCDGASPQVIRINVADGTITHRIATAATPDALTAGSI